MLINKAILFGFGSHGKSMYPSLCDNYSQILIVEKYSMLPKKPNISLRNSDKILLQKNFNHKSFSGASFYIGVGLLNKFTVRKKLFSLCINNGCKLPPFLHMRSMIEPYVIINQSVFVGANVYINHGCVIGENTILNTSTSIDHDVSIGKNCFIGPGVTICGGVSIGDDVLIGAGSVIRDNAVIDSKAIFPMCSVIK